MVHTNPEFENFEFDQHLGSHKHVINIIMWFRDMGCYKSAQKKKGRRGCGAAPCRQLDRGRGLVCGTPRGEEEGGSGGQQRRTTGRGDGRSGSTVQQGEVERGVWAHEAGEFRHR
jgi:hypothetical protein